MFWNDTLNRFHIVNKTLQSASSELTTVVDLNKSLEIFLSGKRTFLQFEHDESKAKEKSGTEEYTSDNSRKRKRKTFFDETNSTNDTLFSASDDIRMNVYYPIMDTLIVNIRKRSEFYIKSDNKFGFLMELNTLSNKTIL